VVVAVLLAQQAVEVLVDLEAGVLAPMLTKIRVLELLIQVAAVAVVAQLERTVERPAVLVL
jgi:hypothetical protein